MNFLDLMREPAPTPIQLEPVAEPGGDWLDAVVQPTLPKTPAQIAEAKARVERIAEADRLNYQREVEMFDRLQAEKKRSA